MLHINVGGEQRNPIGSIADPNMTICVGLGIAQIEKDGVVLFDGEKSDEIKTLAEFEEIAKKSPNSKWICRMETPLWDAVWKRQQIWENPQEGQWICIENWMGFA